MGSKSDKNRGGTISPLVLTLGDMVVEELRVPDQDSRGRPPLPPQSKAILLRVRSVMTKTTRT